MAKTKDQFEDIGVVKKIDTNGMAVFDMPLLDAKGKPTKNTEEMKLAIKCEKGDRVVKLLGKRVFIVIPADEWANMPATEEEALTASAEVATPQLGDILKRLEAAEKKNEESSAQIENLTKKNAELEAKLGGANT